MRNAIKKTQIDFKLNVYADRFVYVWQVICVWPRCMRTHKRRYNNGQTFFTQKYY